VDNILLEIQSVPGNTKRLVLTMTENWFDVSGNSIAWHEIDRVIYSAVDRYINGAYMGTNFTVAVRGATKKEIRFLLDSGTKGALKHKVDHERRNRNKVEFENAITLLEERVGNRLVSEAVAAVRAGGMTEFGGLRLDPEGVHKPGLFRKSARWDEIVGTDVKHVFLRVLVRKGERTKKAMDVHRYGWNAVLLPRVIAILAATRRA
jgi:hypothetical protein